MSWPTSYRAGAQGSGAAAGTLGRPGLSTGGPGRRGMDPFERFLRARGVDPSLAKGPVERALSSPLGKTLTAYAGLYVGAFSLAWKAIDYAEWLDDYAAGLKAPRGTLANWVTVKTHCDGPATDFRYVSSTTGLNDGQCYPSQGIPTTTGQWRPFIQEFTYKFTQFGIRRGDLARQLALVIPDDPSYPGRGFWPVPVWVPSMPRTRPDELTRAPGRAKPVAMPIARAPAVPRSPEDSRGGYGAPPLSIGGAVPMIPAFTYVAPGVRPIARPIPDVRTVPVYPDKDAKLKMSKGLGRIVYWYNQFTELGDVIEALYKAIPKTGCKAMAGRNKAYAVSKCFSQIDWSKAIFNLVFNEVEDAIYAKMGLPTKEAGLSYGAMAPINMAIGKVLGDSVAGSLKGAEGLAAAGYDTTAQGVADLAADVMNQLERQFSDDAWWEQAKQRAADVSRRTPKLGGGA